jgi:ketosteroid isomerase-like protein
MDSEYSESLLATVRNAPASGPGDLQTKLHEVYTAVIGGNFDAFGEAVTDDVELNIVGFGPLHGTWRGRKDVVDATRRNFGLLSNQQPEIEGIISQGDCVAVLMRETGMLKSNGQAYSLRGIQWFTFADGKIKKIDEILASIWKS